MTYRDAGVNIDAGNAFAKRLGPLAKSTLRPEILSGIGGFAGISALPSGLSDPLLVSSTDGVGTKLMIAFATGTHGTVGIDLVAMGVNDILTVGAEPLFFLDYLSTGALDPDQAELIISGVVEGCKQAGCALLGGETAEMPGMYAPGEYDLAGFAVGVVDRTRLLDGTGVQVGDAVIGLPSSGIHSNGYSLARKVLLAQDPDLNRVIPQLGRSLGAELLEPTRIYVSAIKKLLGVATVHAMAHITGGGLVDNPPRVIPEDLAVRFNTSSWRIPPVMALIEEQGGVSREEMLRTFNMGIGMIAFLPREAVDVGLEALAGEDARVIGEVILRQGSEVEFVA